MHRIMYFLIWEDKLPLYACVGQPSNAREGAHFLNIRKKEHFAVLELCDHPRCRGSVSGGADPNRDRNEVIRLQDVSRGSRAPRPGKSAAEAW